MGNLDVTTPQAFSVRAAPVNPVTVSTNGHVVILVPVPGAVGPTGPAGTGTQVFGETPTGIQDGVNETFTVADTYTAGSTAVYRNGLREIRGVGYTESAPNQIIFTSPPLGSDMLTVDYLIQ